MYNSSPLGLRGCIVKCFCCGFFLCTGHSGVNAEIDKKVLLIAVSSPVLSRQSITRVSYLTVAISNNAINRKFNRNHKK